MGKEIADVVDQNLTPGIYTAEFDASALPSGTYFYRLTAGSFTETKKMILIK
ncbi:MAG: T9SS type A sorting domain-containing protein [Ignavibacteria bacterium]|nr:T9SS type A sorting domain-containing protein [Ignavibacteria bacterium]